MKETIQELQEVEGVKSVERHGTVLKLKLFSKKVPGTEVFKIPGDLRKTSQQIRSILDESDKSWEWNVKPEKKYRDRSLKKSNLSDREPKGYNRNFYEVTIQK